MKEAANRGGLPRAGAKPGRRAKKDFFKNEHKNDYTVDEMDRLKNRQSPNPGEQGRHLQTIKRDPGRGADPSNTARTSGGGSGLEKGSSHWESHHGEGAGRPLLGRLIEDRGRYLLRQVLSLHQCAPGLWGPRRHAGTASVPTLSATHFVSGHFKEYQRLGDAAIKVIGDFTPPVERISIEEPLPTSRAAPIASVRNCKGDPPTRAGRASISDLGRRSAHQASGKIAS
jgi:hypothetical protein